MGFWGFWGFCCFILYRFENRWVFAASYFVVLRVDGVFGVFAASYFIILRIGGFFFFLHIRNHKDTRCRQRYDPMPVKEENPNFNTMSCEQTFAWLARYKKIVVSMGKCHHHFYLHRMVKRRNRYIAFCYANNRRLVQPKVRFISKK